jgi:SSS family transporter
MTYLLVTVLIGLIAARRVKSSADFAVAGRDLPLVMVITTTFATWFGSETVMGVPATFVEKGLGGVVEDPFGAGLSLVLVGFFFARRLYRMSLFTISDFYRERFGSRVEVVCSLLIMISYLGWVSAQITALGIILSEVSGGALSVELGMVLSLGAVMLYTIYGGMWSVAVTDLIQMIVLVVGLLGVAWMASELMGGVRPALELVENRGLTRFWPQWAPREVLVFLSAAFTMMFGSIPQQDVFQRVMSARDESTASVGAVVGGLSYLAFAFVPMFLIASALVISPESSEALIKSGELQRVLPQLILTKMPLAMQVLFFGALLSAIMSTASAALLAPSVTFNENVLRYLRPPQGEREALRSMRLTTLGFGLLVLVYAWLMAGSSIYELVSSSYQVILVGTFVPLVAGLFWLRANTQGAWGALLLGVGSWGVCLLLDHELAPLVGLIGSALGMWVGTLTASQTNTPTTQTHPPQGRSAD